MTGHLIDYVLVTGLCGAVVGQTQPREPRLDFEVASVRISERPDSQHPPSQHGGPGSEDPEHFTIRRLTLPALLGQVFQISNAGERRFSVPKSVRDISPVDIDAKVPPGTTREQLNVMIRNLLADRFHLAYHVEKKEVPAGAFGRLDPDGFPYLAPGMTIVGSPANGQMSFTARGVTLSSVVQEVQGQVGGDILVVDKTGLTATYDYHLRYAMPVSPGGPIPDDVSAPDILTAIKQQLGLTVEKGTGLVETFVIDHLDSMPTED